MDIENRVDELLSRVPVVVNIGVVDFRDNLIAQGVQVVQIEWSPPAGGDKQMLDLLDHLL